MAFKLQEKPSALNRERLVLQNMKFINLFSIFVVQFCPGSGSGLRILIRIQGHRWIWIQSRSGSGPTILVCCIILANSVLMMKFAKHVFYCNRVRISVHDFQEADSHPEIVLMLVRIRGGAVLLYEYRSHPGVRMRIWGLESRILPRSVKKSLRLCARCFWIITDDSVSF